MSDLVRAATAEVRTALEPAADGDWSVAAGDLEWTCRQTAAHVADDLFSYASQVLARPTSGYLPVEAVVEERGSNAAPPTPGPGTRAASRTPTGSPRWAPSRRSCTARTHLSGLRRRCCSTVLDGYRWVTGLASSSGRGTRRCAPTPRPARG